MSHDGHELIQRLATAAGIPSGVHLQIADRCNHACLHCYQVQGRKGELSTDEIKAILDDLARSGVMLLNVSGGEATLRPDLLEILAYARQIGFAVRLFTNAYTMTDELAQALRRIGLLGVDVSIYSDDPDQHDSVTRVPGSHARTLAGIRSMLAAGLRVHLKTPTTSASPDAGQRVQRLAKELGHGVNVLTSFDITPMETGDLSSREMLAAPEDLVARGLMKPWQPGERTSSSALEKPTCGACKDGVAVMPNGDLRPCTDIVAPVGNLRERRFLELYREPGPQMVRELTWASIHGCRDCDLRAACERCHAHAANESGDLLGPYASGCRSALARYRGGLAARTLSLTDVSTSPPPLPELTFLPPGPGCAPDRSPTMGPFAIVEPGVLQPIADVLTADDLERREEFPWVRPSRQDLERLSYGEQGPSERKRLPVISRPSGRV